MNPSKDLKPTMLQCSLSPGRFLSGHNFQKFDIWGAKIVSKFFSPWFRWVLPAGLAVGPRLPRRHTAALRSQLWARFSRRAASRGQGSGGCAERRLPRPRTRICGGKCLEAMGWLWGNGWNVDLIHDSSFWWVFVFTSYGKCKPRHVRRHFVFFIASLLSAPLVCR